MTGTTISNSNSNSSNNNNNIKNSTTVSSNTDGLQQQAEMPESGERVHALTKFDRLPDVRTIMVTGGAGFVGSWTVRSFCHTYGDMYKVIAFDKMEYAATMNNLESLRGKANFEFVAGDITSDADVSSCITEHKVDAVIHFAAQSHIDSSFTDPYSFGKANITGCHILLERAKRAGVKRFLHMSSYEVYGSTPAGPSGHLEDERLEPVNPYAASKACGETLVAAYGRSSSMETFIVRSQNVYGPNQYPEKIIPKFAMLIDRAKMLPLYGSGNNTRRYVHAGDVAEAYNVVLHRGKPGEVYNIGSAHEISNKDLCRELIKAVKPAGCDPSDLDRWLKPTPDRPFHDRGSSLDCSKLRELGWQQTISLEQGLVETVEWYKAYGGRWWGESPLKGM